MLDLIHNLALGFGVAFSPMNMFLCLIGALVAIPAAAALRLLLNEVTFRRLDRS